LVGRKDSAVGVQRQEAFFYVIALAPLVAVGAESVQLLIKKKGFGCSAETKFKSLFLVNYVSRKY
jgi:hypothetical protein